MRTNKCHFLFLIFIFILLSACSPTEGSEQSEDKVELTLSAAASMVDAIEEIITTFEKENNNISILLNVGSSGALQQQITQGAPVDLFLSAAEDKFNYLLEKGLIDMSNYSNLLENQLVLIQPMNTNVKLSTFNDFLHEDIDKVAIGTPETVPAGSYAKQTLENLHIYDKVKEKLVFAKDVRQVLNYVETGNVQAGIVYKTDALQSDAVRVVTSVNEANHDPIIYPIGVLKGTKHKQEAVALYDFLKSEHSLQIFEEYGFKPLSD